MPKVDHVLEIVPVLADPAACRRAAAEEAGYTPFVVLPLAERAG